VKKDMQTPKEVDMSSPKIEIFEMYAQEHNSRILKASDDARLLRSLSRKSGSGTRQFSLRASLPRLVNILASLLLSLKHQPA
jgi:hypothetical protein